MTMARIAIGAMIVLAVALAALSRSGDAQQFVLPTPKGQLGGAPPAPSAAIPVTPPVPPLATIPIVFEQAPTPPAAETIATAPASAHPATPRTGVASNGLIDNAVRSVVTVVVAGAATPASGTIVADGRHVVTALDAVGSASGAEVISADGVRESATVVGGDPESGLAVLQIDDGAEPALDFAKTPLAVGDAVVAMAGAASRVEQSKSSGVVTSTSVWRPTGPPAALLVAIDPPAAPPANGGALIGPDGLLAGVLIDDRLAGASETGGQPGSLAAGVGFAVPAPVVARVVDDLVNLSHVNYPWLGVVTAPAAVQAGSIQVVAVIPDSPAAQAGIEAGDVLVALDGRGFGPEAPASVSLLAHTPGDRVRIELRRDGSAQTVAATLGARPPA
jgi:putative serine protease PepD